MAIQSTSRIRSSGLVSGLDTETLVKQMTALTKSKINLQQQRLDSLQWKQTAYRGVISSINTFKSTYFNTLNPLTNLASNSLFGARQATSSNPAVKVTASSNALEASYTISNVIAKAEAATITSDSGVAGGIKADLSAVESGKEYIINVSVSGNAKDVKFTYDSSLGTTAEEQLAQTLDDSFASSEVKFTVQNGVIKVSDASAQGNIAHTLKINRTTTSTAENLAALGINTDGATSQLSSSSKLGDIAFNTALVGNSFAFSINGVDFKFDKSETVSTVMSTINNSSAGVKVNLDNLSGKFVMTSTVSGTAGTIDIKQTSGGLLTSMFDGKIGASTSLSSESLIANGISSDKIQGTFNFAEHANSKIAVTVNGVTKNISLWTYDSTGTKNDFTKSSAVVNQINSELKREFGVDAPTLSFKNSSGNSSVVDGNFTLVGANRGDVITVGAVAGDDKSDAFISALGFNADNSTNEVTSSASIFAGVDLSGVGDSDVLGRLSFDSAGTVFEVTKNTTYADIEAASNGAFKFENGRIILTQANTSAMDAGGIAFMEGLFGDISNFPDASGTQNSSSSFVAEGKNAVVEINGTVISNNSNQITLNGTTIDISSLTVGATDITIDTAKDSTQAVAAIKGFVEDYNKLIGDLYSTIREQSDSDYSPLTEEQKEEMTEKEIEKWEAEAKKGLLYQDQTLNRFLTELRSAVNGVNSSGLGLFNMGITVSSSYLDFGKLELDEAALTKAIGENPDGIQQFFTNNIDGLATKVTTTINKYANTSSTSRGLLVQIAGAENTTSATNNRISKQLEAYKTLIESLQTKYENEQERYWKQFTNLEKVMASYSSQSSWLAQQFGGTES